jgi:hypothetical protein
MASGEPVAGEPMGHSQVRQPADVNTLVKQGSALLPLTPAPPPPQGIKGTAGSAKALLSSTMVGATGFEPVTSSVSGTAGRWRRPALSGRMWLVNRQEAGPLVTVVVRCNPVVRAPDVAPMWPQRSRAWKARPGTPPSRDPTPMAQLRVFLDRPLLSVADRQGPMLRARRGHGTARTNPVPRGSDGYKLN